MHVRDTIRSCPPVHSLLLVLGLAFSLFTFSAVGPTTSGASAMITAEKGNAAVSWARSRKGSPYAVRRAWARAASTAPA